VYRADISIDDVWSGSGAAPSGAASLSWWLANQYNVNQEDDLDASSPAPFDVGMLVDTASSGGGKPKAKISGAALGVVAAAMIAVACTVLAHKRYAVPKAEGTVSGICVSDTQIPLAPVDTKRVQTALLNEVSPSSATRSLCDNDVSDMWEDPAM
jgi:hypothetical protein